MYPCTHLIMLVQLDSSEINSPHNNGILSRCTLGYQLLRRLVCSYRIQGSPQKF